MLVDRRWFGWLLGAVGGVILGLSVALLAQARDLGDKESAVIERDITTPQGPYRCYVWLGAEMSWGIRPFTNLGCWPIPPAEPAVRGHEEAPGAIYFVTTRT